VGLSRARPLRQWPASPRRGGVPETLDPDRLLDLKVEADHEVDQEDGIADRVTHGLVYRRAGLAAHRRADRGLSLFGGGDLLPRAATSVGVRVATSSSRESRSPITMALSPPSDSITQNARLGPPASSTTQATSASIAAAS